MNIRHSIRHLRVNHTAIVSGIAAAIFGLGGCDTYEPETVDTAEPNDIRPYAARPFNSIIRFNLRHATVCPLVLIHGYFPLRERYLDVFLFEPAIDLHVDLILNFELVVAVGYPVHDHQVEG